MEDDEELEAVVKTIQADEEKRKRLVVLRVLDERDFVIDTTTEIPLDLACTIYMEGDEATLGPVATDNTQKEEEKQEELKGN